MVLIDAIASDKPESHPAAYQLLRPRMTRGIMRRIGSRFGTGCPSHLRNRAMVFSSGGFDGSDIDFSFPEQR